MLRWQRYISVQHHLTMALRTKYRPLRETTAALPISNLSCVFWAGGVRSLPDNFRSPQQTGCCEALGWQPHPHTLKYAVTSTGRVCIRFEATFGRISYSVLGRKVLFLAPLVRVRNSETEQKANARPPSRGTRTSLNFYFCIRLYLWKMISGL